MVRQAHHKFTNQGSLAVAVAALLWSFDGILRRSLYTVPPSVIVFYEHLLGGIILLLAGKEWISEAKTLSKKGWLAIAIVAFFSGALGTIFYTAALGQVNYIQYSVVVLLQQLQPIWAISASALLLKENISKKFILLAVLALLSAYLVAFRDLTINFASGQGTIIAAVLALGAGMLWGSSTAVSKYVLTQVSFLTATALRFLLTPIFALIIIVILNQTDSLPLITPAQWGTLFLITFSTGMVALGIYYYGLKRIPAHVSTIIELLFPLSAVLIDYLYFKNTLSITQLLGSIILLFVIVRVIKLRDETKKEYTKKTT